ncbi:hypothetical protein GTZ99_05365 [Novosphingobium sp. FSY-8]|uniref:VOC domain-containing protein n=1 Tax=Novosphingobium ovatum TaxID=1908523 RepID=A0ABW9XBR4_9SPHN|nr:VOC family protein [Novosphingobium ovatum]NBC35982.1 hypothetical protein [Novosphingobium ovatum]
MTEQLTSIDAGFQEAVAIVADPHASARRICAATGYVTVAQGAVDAGALALMEAQGRKASEVLIGHPSVPRGRIRLIGFEGTPAPLMRDGGQAWDTGGIFDINLRSLPSIETLHRGLSDQGFVAQAPITDWDFGPLEVREVVDKDADGVCIALMERVRPPLAGYNGVAGPASQVFNSTQVVPDFDAARHLYHDCLGWKPVQETDGPAARADGANCMGFPVEIAAKLRARIGIYQAQGAMMGSVEVIQFGVRGLDFSHSAPPQRGWASVRLPVSDVGDFAARAARGGCRIVGPVAVDWRPHGRFRAVAAITPWGARLEAYQAV